MWDNVARNVLLGDVLPSWLCNQNEANFGGNTYIVGLSKIWYQPCICDAEVDGLDLMALVPLMVCMNLISLMASWSISIGAQSSIRAQIKIWMGLINIITWWYKRVSESYVIWIDQFGIWFNQIQVCKTAQFTAVRNMKVTWEGEDRSKRSLLSLPVGQQSLSPYKSSKKVSLSLSINKITDFYTQEVKVSSLSLVWFLLIEYKQ